MIDGRKQNVRVRAPQLPVPKGTIPTINYVLIIPPEGTHPYLPATPEEDYYKQRRVKGKETERKRKERKTKQQTNYKHAPRAQAESRGDKPAYPVAW